MTDSIPISGVDALIAHFAEWVRFLEAKGIEFEIQQAKLDARRAKTNAPESTGERDFLDIVFDAQAKLDMPPPAKPAKHNASSLIQSEEPLPLEKAVERAADHAVFPEIEDDVHGTHDDHDTHSTQEPASPATEMTELDEAASIPITAPAEEEDLA